MLPKINNLFRMTRNPEVINTASGNTICKMGLVVSEKYKDNETTLFIDGVAFGRGGEVIAQHFSKGDLIFISGKLSPNDYQKQDGTKVKGFQLIVESFEFTGGNRSSSNQHEEAKRNGYQRQNDLSVIPQGDDDSDAVPF